MAAGGVSKSGVGRQTGSPVGESRGLRGGRGPGVCAQATAGPPPQAERPLLPLLSAVKDPWCPGSHSPRAQERAEDPISGDTCPPGSAGPKTSPRIATPPPGAGGFHQLAMPISSKPGIL